MYSAGLDITSLYQSKPEAAVVFWKALQDYWISLYGSSKIYIAAINVRGRSNDFVTLTIGIRLACFARDTRRPVDA